MSAVLLHALIPDPAALASLGPWLGLAALGVFHGLNPAMGWLFAVSLALQRQQAAQLYTATGYIAIGHLASVVIIMVALARGRRVSAPEDGCASPPARSCWASVSTGWRDTTGTPDGSA